MSFFDQLRCAIYGHEFNCTHLAIVGDPRFNVSPAPVGHVKTCTRCGFVRAATPQERWDDGWWVSPAELPNPTPAPQPAPPPPTEWQGAPWEPHPKYPMEDWRYEVSNGDTVIGYADWVRHQLEVEESCPIPST